MFNKKLLFISMAVAGTMLITACGSDEVSQATAEEQRTIARSNSMMVANQFVAENPIFNNHRVVPNGDSTIDTTCPQGDGWASLKLIDKNNHSTSIKCSTFSMGIGCLLGTDFNRKKNYKQQDGRCNYKLKYPLPKIAG